MIKKLHILLTYSCSLRCKHCYVFSDQRAPGKISLSQISYYLKEGLKQPELKWIYFGGGEPFTQYPLLLKAIHRARKLGYEVGVETNGYFARTDAAALRLLRPLAEMGVKDICISNDLLHYKNPDTSPAKRALAAAHQLGLNTTLVRVLLPKEPRIEKNEQPVASSIIEPRLMFSGRASETIASDREAYDWQTFTGCPRKDLGIPNHLFIDAYGFVQICPGIAIGNAYEQPMHEIIENYNIREHTILHPLRTQGPSALIREHGLQPIKNYVDACHCCYATRRALIDRYPHILGPRHVYGY